MDRETAQHPKLTVEAASSVPVMILRAIAANLRVRYPSYRIEAHPINSTRATLLLKYRKLQCVVTACMATTTHVELRHKADYKYLVPASAISFYKVIKVHISEPNSIDILEKHINGVIDVMQQAVEIKQSRTRTSETKASS